MLKVRVHNMTSPKSGRDVPNQFIIEAPDGTYFQSYSSIIAFVGNEGQVYLDSYYWNYSRTTNKYRNEFLDEDTKETKAKIKSHEYLLTDLNS